MIALIIIGVIVILLVILNLTPVSLHILYEDKLSVLAKFGSMKFHIYPKQKEEPVQKKSKKQKEKVQTDTTEKKEKFSIKEYTADEIKSLLQVVLNAVSGFRRRLIVRKFKFWYVSSYEDPYKTVQNYGLANNLLCTVGSFADQYLHFKDVDIRTATDYSVGKPYYNIDIDFSIRIGQLVHVAFRAGIAAWKIIKKHKKTAEQTRQQEKAA